MAPENAALSVGLYKHGKNYALIAANLEPQPVRARIRSRLDVGVDRLSVLSEGRSVRTVDGTVEDHFDGFGVHLYTTLANAPSLPMSRILRDPRFLRGPRHHVRPGNLASGTQGATAKASHTIWQFNSAVFAIDDDPETCWNTSAWATWGKKSGDWLEVTLRRPATLRRVVVRSWKPKHFHDFDDVGNLLADFDLQMWSEKQWKTVKEVRGNDSEVVQISFAAVSTPKLRIVVKRGLCLAEVEAHAR